MYVYYEKLVERCYDREQSIEGKIYGNLFPAIAVALLRNRSRSAANLQPLYITRTTHEKLMLIVNIIGGRKATISSYVENILLQLTEQIKTVNGYRRP